VSQRVERRNRDDAACVYERQPLDGGDPDPQPVNEPGPGATA
jgi:hypothetical protein